MASRIQVCVRLKPDPDMAGVNVAADTGSIEVASWRRDRSNGKPAGADQGSRIRFQVDRILDPGASQADVFEACGQPFISNFFQGYNGTIMAYGQTGAGKTHTIMGPGSGPFEERGLCARVIASVFEEADRRRRQVVGPDGSAPPPPEITLQLSALEIYNETVLDLLAPPPTRPPGSVGPAPAPPDLSIYELQDGSIMVPQLSMPVMASLDEALHCLFAADMARAWGEHELNADSTRSHCIYTLHLTLRHRGGGSEGSEGEEEEEVTCAKLHIVDLAGSERIFRTGSTSGVMLKEAAYINKSLSFLEQVVVALTDEKREHIPYRQCKLTHFLKDSLNGNCRTLLIACVWPTAFHAEQTISTLRFATRMMCIRTDPVVNRRYGGSASPAFVARLMRQIKELKEELAMHDRLAGRDPGEQPVPYGELTPQQNAAIQQQVSAFLSDAHALPPVLTLAQVRATFLHLRTLALHQQPSPTTALQPTTTTTRPLLQPQPPPPQHQHAGPPHRPTPSATHKAMARPHPGATPPTPLMGLMGPDSTSHPSAFTSPPKPPRGSPALAAAAARPPLSSSDLPPTPASCFVLDAGEKETGEGRGAGGAESTGLAGRARPGGAGAGRRRRLEAEEEEAVVGEDREEEEGVGAEEGGQEREAAFARFRLTETGVRDANVLKTVKLRLRHVKDRLKSASRSLKAATAELGQDGGGEEGEEEEQEGGLSYAEGYVRRDARRRQQRLEKQVQELQDELRSLQDDKKAAVRRMVRDFKDWWRRQQGSAGAAEDGEEGGGEEGDEEEEEMEEEAPGLSLPALALPPRSVSTTGSMHERPSLMLQHESAAARPWSMSVGGSQHHHPQPGPAMERRRGGGGGGGPVPCALSPGQISYEVARHQAMTDAARSAAGSGFQSRSPTRTGAYHPRSSNKASGGSQHHPTGRPGHTPQPQHHRGRTIIHHRRHSAGL